MSRARREMSWAVEPRFVTETAVPLSARRLIQMSHEPICLNSSGRNPKRILIDIQHFTVHQKGGGVGIQFADVAADHERGASHDPHGHVRLVFEERHACAADLPLAFETDDEHVEVVPAADAAVRVDILRDVDGDVDADGAPGVHVDVHPRVEHVARDAPHVTADLFAPQMRSLIAPFAQRVKELTPRVAERFAHARVAFDGDGLIEERRVTVVVFEEVDAPRCPELCVLIFEAETARVARAGHLCRIGVDAELEAFLVDIICQRFDAVGEFFGVGDEIAVAVAMIFDRPAIVNDDVVVAAVFQPC